MRTRMMRTTMEEGTMLVLGEREEEEEVQQGEAEVPGLWSTMNRATPSGLLTA